MRITELAIYWIQIFDLENEGKSIANLDEDWEVNVHYQREYVAKIGVFRSFAVHNGIILNVLSGCN